MNPFISKEDAEALNDMRRRGIEVHGSCANVAIILGKSEGWWSRVINGRFIPN